MPLVAFDFDGTLSDDEMIVLLAERAGCAEEVADVTRRAMEGELSYAESLRQRASLLDGLSEEQVADAYDEVALRENAAALLAALDEADVPTAILTGGFEAGVARALEREDVTVDLIVANRLPLVDGCLTGTVEGPLIDGTKDDALHEATVAFDVSIDDTVAIGDGANDVPMLDEAGTAIGFRPKSGVADHCDAVVETMVELRNVLVEVDILDV